MTVDQQAGTSLRRGKLYPAYKDTSVEWLGQIPSHWRVTKMWDVAQATSGGTPAKETLRYWDGGVPWVSPKDMKRRFIDSSEDTVSVAAVSETALKLVPNPAVLVVVRGMILAHSFPVGITKVPVTINQDMKALRLRDDVAPEFFGYWLEGMGRDLIAVLVDEAAHGTKAIRMERWRVTPVAIPPEDEQRAITMFLDRETARIDGLVAKKERLIELLQEKRGALITRAVTKGLDPTVPMKDSGVEWLGQTPAHWGADRIKWAARMESGHTPDKKVDAYWQGGTIPWVSLADTSQLREVDYILDTAVRTTADGIAHSSARILPPGTVVFSRDATVGLCAITNVDMAVSQHFIGWVCSQKLLPEYLLLVFRSMAEELERLTMGATVRTIGMPDVTRLVTPIPPVLEQQQIVEYVHRHRSQIDNLVAKVRDAVDRLRELRTALISAAVTGKIDVRAA
jgi:type I restriction enzyme S subunit